MGRCMKKVENRRLSWWSQEWRHLWQEVVGDASLTIFLKHCAESNLTNDTNLKRHESV